MQKKEVNESKIFIEGLMTVGCSCQKNTTLGFELMLQPETPRNVFRFLMSRFVDKSIAMQVAVK